MIKRIEFTILMAALFACVAPAIAADTALELSSGAKQVTLIELFTSEGCSSCPPADLKVSRLKSNPQLWTDFIPVAFHVDYWNYIGWEDRFSNSEFSDRQMRYVDEQAVRFAYTPGFFQNGQEWKRWYLDEPATENRGAAGDLRIRVAGQKIDLRFDTAMDTKSGLVANIALLGMNLESRVSAGENSGRTLQHDFVVLGLKSVPLAQSGGAHHADSTLPAPSVRHSDLAVVVWISDDRMQAPIQAVGGYLGT